MTSLAEYYEREGFFPSFRNLKSHEDFDRHEATRAALLHEHLKLPKAFFRNARIGEFGPDTGENALVFAKWGGLLTLVEPNARAHETIRAYFAKFRLEDHLAGLFADKLENCRGGPFDFVNAEGFVAALGPPARWLDTLSALTASEGYFHISYFEKRGAFVELLTNALIRIEAAAHGDGALGAAARLMTRKWETVGHSRPMEAWVRDHIENPAARLGAMLGAEEVFRQGIAAGFRLHASAPGYADPLQIAWPKTIASPEATCARAAAHLDRSALSMAIGAKAYWTGPQDAAAKLARRIDDVCASADAVIATRGDDREAIGVLEHALQTLNGWICEEETCFLSEDGMAPAQSFLGGASEALRSVLAGCSDALSRYCNENQAFLNLWGSPVHHVVFRKAAK